MKKAAISLGVFGLCLFLVGTFAQIYTPGTGGSGGSGGGLTNGYSFDSAAFRTANDTNIFLKDGVNLTNPVVTSSISSTGGATRGVYSVDLQMARDVSTRVASGAFSALLAGSNNVAGGVGSVVVGGTLNRVYGNESFASGTGNISSNSQVSGAANFTFATDSFNFGDRTVILGGKDNWINAQGGGIVSNSPPEFDSSFILGSYLTEIQKTSNGVQTTAFNGIIGGEDSRIIDTASGLILGSKASSISNASYAAMFGGSANKIESATNTIAIGFQQTNNVSHSIKLGAGPDTSVHIRSNHGVTIGGVLHAGTIHLAVPSNHVATLIGGTIYGTNQHYITNVVGNLTLADSGLRANVPYYVALSNTTSTVSVPSTWVYPDIPSGLTPNFQGGLYELELKVQFGKTNAWVRKGPANDLAFGWQLGAGTNSGVVTMNQTNRFIRPASTNATEFRPDFSQNTNEFWITSSRTNVTLWPTNLVDGRDITFVFTASVVNYDVTFTNFGVLVYWPFGAGTNGTTSLTVTNGQGLEVNLRARTNAVWAAFSRFIL